MNINNSDFAVGAKFLGCKSFISRASLKFMYNLNDRRKRNKLVKVFLPMIK